MSVPTYAYCFTGVPRFRDYEDNKCRVKMSFEYLDERGKPCPIWYVFKTDLPYPYLECLNKLRRLYKRCLFDTQKEYGSETTENYVWNDLYTEGKLDKDLHILVEIFRHIEEVHPDELWVAFPKDFPATFSEEGETFSTARIREYNILYPSGDE
jgi:hypothetical protein